MIKAFIFGRFNYLHAGHIRLFRFAKEHADELIVGVIPDSAIQNSSYLSSELRLEAVASNVYVDEAFVCSPDPLEVISELRPDLVVKGREFELKENPEIAVLASYGGKLMFGPGAFDLPFENSFVEEMNEKFRGEYMSRCANFMSRHAISRQRLVKLIDRFKTLKVVVVGDLILDEYIECNTVGMSQEDPLVVFSPGDSESFVGGAGIVAGHASGLGASVEFFTVCGSRNDGEAVKDRLEVRNKLITHMFVDESRPTTSKQRFRCAGRTVFRLSKLNQDPIPADVSDALLASCEEVLADSDLLIFSDFNYGCLSDKLISKLIDAGHRNNVLMAADCQSSSQMGDITKYKDVDLLTPTEREARIGLRNTSDGLVALASQLKLNTSARHVLLKLGSEGLLAHVYKNGDLLTDQLPALNPVPIDVAGAGDSLLVGASLAMAVGANEWEMGVIGSLLAAIQVGQKGNINISSDALKKCLV